MCGEALVRAEVAGEMAPAPTIELPPSHLVDLLPQVARAGAPRCGALFILRERPASLGLPAVGARPSPHGAPLCLLLSGTSLVLRVQIQQGSNPTRSQVLQVEV